MSNQEGNRPRRRRWPDPEKKVGLCSIYELGRELQAKMERGLDPYKRLRDCSEEELEAYEPKGKEKSKNLPYPW